MRKCYICGKPITSRWKSRMVCDYHGSLAYGWEKIKYAFNSPFHLQLLVVCLLLIQVGQEFIPKYYMILWNLGVVAFIWIMMKRGKWRGK